MIGEYTNLYPPVTAVLTAIFVLPVVPLVHIMLMRLLKRKQKRILFMFFSFVVYGILWLLMGSYLNNFMPVSISSLIAGISVIAFLCIGYARVFIIICTSVSLRISLDIYLHGSLTPPQIIENYGEKGMDWMFGKRIEALKSLRMAKVNGDMLEIKRPLGAFVGKAGLFVKNVLKMAKGG